ncbi:uncharacterized protein LOC144448213 [Glandiceps talaboti]
MRSASKDIYHLMRSIRALSDDQAEVVDIEEEENTIFVSIVPNGGLYCGGKFIFKIHLRSGYPFYAPDVVCLTPIYHPNIDNILAFDENEAEICINLLDDWQVTFNLEHVIQAILFLFYQPNLEDPISPMFEPKMDEGKFVENVTTSLQGGLVEGIWFPRNLSLLPRQDVHDEVREPLQSREDENVEMKVTTTAMMENIENQPKNKCHAGKRQ